LNNNIDLIEKYETKFLNAQLLLSRRTKTIRAKRVHRRRLNNAKKAATITIKANFSFLTKENLTIETHFIQLGSCSIVLRRLIIVISRRLNAFDFEISTFATFVIATSTLAIAILSRRND